MTDAAVLANSTSGAIVVAASGKTSRHELRAAIASLETVGARVAGVVMTMMPTRGPDAYYGQYGGYGGYGGYRLDHGKGPRTTRPARRSTDEPPADATVFDGVQRTEITPDEVTRDGDPLAAASRERNPGPVRSGNAEFDELLAGRKGIDPLDVTTRRRS